MNRFDRFFSVLATLLCRAALLLFGLSLVAALMALAFFLYVAARHIEGTGP